MLPICQDIVQTTPSSASVSNTIYTMRYSNCRQASTPFCSACAVRVWTLVLLVNVAEPVVPTINTVLRGVTANHVDPVHAAGISLRVVSRKAAHHMPLKHTRNTLGCKWTGRGIGAQGPLIAHTASS
jgi:hypothetical protein